MEKVSVIVISYNIESYIERCLDSIINQTFNDLEIIIVDDGSNDSTLTIINSKSKLDKRIKVIDKINEGPLLARKVGFEEARGEYILFVDGDDWLREDAIEKLYSTAIKENYDLVYYKFFLAYDDGNLIKSKIKSEYEVNDFLKMALVGDVIPSMWSKFIKRDFIIKNKMEFPPNILMAEDLAFTCVLGIHNPKFVILDEYLYYYYQRSNSITNNENKKELDINIAVDFIKAKLDSKGILVKYKEEYNYLVFLHLFFLRLDSIYNTKNKIGKEIYKNWAKKGINIYKNKYFIELFKDEPLKSKLVFRVFTSNYKRGLIYNKIKSS